MSIATMVDVWKSTHQTVTVYGKPRSMFVNKQSGIVAYRKLSRSTNRYVYVLIPTIGGDSSNATPASNASKATDIVKRRCPVYLPKDVADQRCDIFNNKQPTSTCTAKMLDHIPYPKTIGQMQYVIGRDVLIKQSGLAALTDTCKQINVFMLPWFDGKSSPDGQRFWTPRLNNMFMKCAAEHGTKSPTSYPIRMVLSLVDMNHIRFGHEFPSSVDVEGETLPVTSVSILARGPSKTVIEMCQLCYNYSSPKNPLRLLAEVNPSHKAMYTCFLLPLSRGKKLAANKTKFIDITDQFIERLLSRLDDNNYKMAEIAGHYYPDEEGEGF